MEEKTIRNKKLLKDKEKMSYRELGLKYGLSQDTIFRIVNRMRIKAKIAELEKKG